MPAGSTRRVIPAQAGIQPGKLNLDSGFRRNDEKATNTRNEAKLNESSGI